jgi:hypothetical protein
MLTEYLHNGQEGDARHCVGNFVGGYMTRT